MRRRAVPVFTLVALVIAACGSGGAPSAPTSSSSSASAYAGKVIQLGAVVSQSGAGAIYGPSQKQGIDLAVDTINRSGGVSGASIAVDIEDDASTQAQAEQQFQTLIQQKQVLALVGPTLSNQAVAAHPIADAARTPVVAISNTGIGIVGTCPYPCDYIFRDSLGEEAAIPANVKTVVASHHLKTAVIMYANDDKFSSDGNEIFGKALSAAGVAVLDRIAFSKNETDFSSFVTTAKGKNPDLLVVSTLGGAASRIIIEARKQGYTGPIVGGNGFNTIAVPKQAGGAGNGAQSASAYYAGSGNPANQSFSSAYRARYGQEPDQIAAQAYTAILVIADAAHRAGLTFADLAADRQHLRDALVTVHLSDTPLGAFSFTAQHDVHQPIYIVAMDGVGAFKLVTTVQPG